MRVLISRQNYVCMRSIRAHLGCRILVRCVCFMHRSRTLATRTRLLSLESDMMCSPSCAHMDGGQSVVCAAEPEKRRRTATAGVRGANQEEAGHLLELGGHPLAVAAPRRVELRQHMLPAVHEIIKVVRCWQRRGEPKEKSARVANYISRCQEEAHDASFRQACMARWEGWYALRSTTPGRVTDGSSAPLTAPTLSSAASTANTTAARMMPGAAKSQDAALLRWDCGSNFAVRVPITRSVPRSKP